LACDGLFIFGEILLHIENKTHIIGSTVGVCAILCLILNYLLVPLMGCYGAILASFVSCLCAGVILMRQGIKAFSFPINWFRTSFGGGLFVYFAIIVCFLFSNGNLIFYSGTFLGVCLVLPFAKFIKFFDDSEKTFIRNWFQMAKVYVNR
jgi:O-antigen/teichoic acid export membrane protein